MDGLSVPLEGDFRVKYNLCLILAVNLLFNSPIKCLYIQTQEHFQPRVHGFEVGMKLEAVSPDEAVDHMPCHSH